jgi:hypothetical protein
VADKPLPKLHEADEPDWDLGKAIFLAREDAAEWIRRRVESIAFIDAVSFRRRVSVDLAVPPAPPRFLPLTTLFKIPLVDFDLRDEQDRSIPLLTREEQGFVAWSTLARIALLQAVEAFGEDKVKTLSPLMLEDLKNIAGGTPAEAEKALKEFGSRREDRNLRIILSNSPLFMEVAEEFVYGFLLLIPTDREPGLRKIVKFSYGSDLTVPSDSVLQRFAGRMGWIAPDYAFLAEGVGESESAHFEFAAPDGLEIAAGEIFLLREAQEEEREQAEDGYISVGAHSARIVGPRAHVNISRVDPDVEGVLTIWLRPQSRGLLAASLTTTLVTLGVLFFFMWDDRIAKISGTGAAALLLSIPGLISAVIVRPGEHGMATSLFTGIRVLTGISGLLAYAGALLVIGAVEDVALVNTWRLLVVAAALCFIGLAAVLFGRQPIGATSAQEDEDGQDDG